ncbi:hypothetical protein, partial [Acidithiobacillus sp.]|uniref:hypothetical protein n=1 Tax=Acidithiobacillus sp. TaxID=1872118 RepID=UPI003D04A1C9
VQPIGAISAKEDPVKATLEQTGLDMKYQEELRCYLDRKDNLRQGMVKAYALVFSNYCSRIMQSRVEEHPEFDTTIKMIRSSCWK